MKLNRFEIFFQYCKSIFLNSFTLLAFFNFSSLIAQPSGGPYGPILQTYELPKDAGKVYYVSPDGQAENSGKSLELPTTLEKAIEKVVTGDAIILRGGTYRTGNLKLNQGITMQPYANEQPILKGTFVADDWTPSGGGLWVTKWDHLFPMKPQDWWRIEREGYKTPLHRFNNDMVFVDGKFLQSAGWQGEVDENSFFINYESGKIYIGVDPSKHLIEITAYNVAIHRVTSEVQGKKPDRKGPVIKGITFAQYAYRAIEIDGIDPEGISDEKDHGKEVIGSTFEHCTITFCSRVAGYFRGDSLTMRHCKISDTSTEGVYVIASSDVLLEKNIFARNNIENITGYYPAAVKIFNQCYRVTCDDNLVIDHPYSNGIWYDVGNVDGVFINNWVEGVGTGNEVFNKDQLWPSRNGFFFEISKNVICAGNVFVDCDHGIMILNSSNAKIYQNTLVNSMLTIGRTSRSAQGDHFGWHPATGPDVDERIGHVIMNNLFNGDKGYDKPLLFIWQPANLCERVNDSQLKNLDYNVYVRGNTNPLNPFLFWSPAENSDCQLAVESLKGLQELYPGFMVNSRLFDKFNWPLFKSSALKNYSLLKSFAGAKTAGPLPDEIRNLLGKEDKHESYIGAYPLVP